MNSKAENLDSRLRGNDGNAFGNDGLKASCSA